MQKVCVWLSGPEDLGSELKQKKALPVISKAGAGFLLLCLGSAGTLLKVQLSLVRVSLWRRQAPHANQGQGLTPTFLHGSTGQSPLHPGSCLAPLYSLFDPNEFGSALHPLRQALLGRGHVCLSLVQPLSSFVQLWLWELSLHPQAFFCS